ncbi:hypothetical protein KNE206_77330 [Kitasatospora sp. NE20-6]|uniref:hypothetical protein n=1 Tax=Kitasatospora sp. NE20-6 TaxID=2859066 RepID=UPI0034DCA83D
MESATPPPASAVYLRCHPRDDWAVETLRRALEEHALRLGLFPPAVYIDNGISSQQAAPRRAALEADVAAGTIGVVLIPGPWVFALDDTAARRAVDALVSRGCEVVELPSRAAPRHERLALKPATAPFALSPAAA